MAAKPLKKTILIDLDGVLNTYRGDFDENLIPEIRPEADYFIKNLVEKGYEIKLFTTRNKILTSKWLIENHLDTYISDVTNVKELCWLYIDDRCLTFDGSFAKLYANILGFKPWYK